MAFPNYREKRCLRATSIYHFNFLSTSPAYSSSARPLADLRTESELKGVNNLTFTVTFILKKINILAILIINLGVIRQCTKSANTYSLKKYKNAQED